MDGVTAGLMREGQTFTSHGRHFGVRVTQTTRMEVLRPFSYFRDVMVDGAFKYYVHEHHFAAMDDGTRVRDEVRFAAPLGPLGRILESLVLRRYLTALLKWRNQALKRVAESEEWHKYLDEPAKVTTITSQPGKIHVA